MDGILLSGACLLALVFDFWPNRKSRNRWGNIFYLLLVCVSIAVVLAVTLFPEMGRISDLLYNLFPAI